MPSIIISTGEPSGDAVGAALATELKALGITEISAIGGAQLRKAGVNIIADSTHWGVIGFIQGLRAASQIKRASRPVARHISTEPPDLLIPIDFGFYNIRLSRLARKHGSKVLYFMPPGSWRKAYQGKDLASVTDKVATPFEWSARLLKEQGCDVEWVGHPVLQFAASIPMKKRNLLALMPGSRKHEVALNLPLIAATLQKLDLGSITPAIVAASNVSDKQIRSHWPASVALPRIWRDGSLSALAESSAGIVCSGTATLEAAVSDVPHVVIYRIPIGAQLQWFLVQHRIKFIAMPSILLDRAVVPELLGKRGNPSTIADLTSRLLSDSPERSQQLGDFAEIRRLLGPTDAITRTAHIAADMLRR